MAMTTVLASQVAAGVAETEYGKRVAESESDGAKMMKEVGRSSLHAFGVLWEGMEEAARIVLSDGADATVEFVGVRYGEEAEEAAKEGFRAAGNVAEVGLSMKRLGVGYLTKVTAREAAEELLTDEELKAKREAEAEAAAPVADSGVRALMMASALLPDGADAGDKES
eukprot:PLAT15233.3.p1 GENE.PLAT15233.3~~PLAT15233.3.p1  ORF type:complete len:168 (-),score=62.61 PLAT15233.3:92-595(-)